MLFSTETQNSQKIIALILWQSVSAAKLICESAATRINTYRFNVVCHGNTEFTENHYLIPWQSVFHCKKLICESAATWIDTDTLMLFATETQNSRKIITLIPCQSVSAAKLIWESAATRIDDVNLMLFATETQNPRKIITLIPWQSVSAAKINLRICGYLD